MGMLKLQKDSKVVPGVKNDDPNHILDRIEVSVYVHVHASFLDFTWHCADRDT